MSRKADAANLFEDFHGRPPKAGEIRTVKMPADADALYIGRVDGLLYKVDGEKAPYFHRFTKKNRPLLFVSSDGKQAYILKGGYTFTERGFIG